MAMAIANPRRRLMVLVLVFNLCFSACVSFVGLNGTPFGWCFAAFVGLFAGTASANCAMTLWMRKTPKTKQGSLFSVLGASRQVVSALVVFLGGAVGERVFEPALAAGGAWSTRLGAWLGTGAGHGLGLLFAITGAVSMVVSTGALVRPSLRRLDDLVDDEVPPEVAEPPTIVPHEAPATGGP
jgi:diaminobutyrate-2-oxoglutarate transaminase